jgi:membrane fusion protein, multidrug efflux system
MPVRSPLATLLLVLLALALLLGPAAALAQPPPGPPPAVGVVRVEQQPVTESNEFVGRVAALDRVNLVARVTGFLEHQRFTEGTEVKKGDLLYTVEKAPFEADVAAKAAAVAQARAQLDNAEINLRRAEALLHTPAGQQSSVDNARATQLSDQAQVLQAQANLRMAEINLGYTDIRAPVAGKIGLTAVTVGNVVSPNSGTLATIVSQDPMYVVFPIAFRAALELRNRYADKGGFDAVVIKLRLPDGRVYGRSGKLDFVNNTISANTDTITLRGTIANPPLKEGNALARELTDGEFVNVVVEGVAPVMALTVPRAAVLADQAGDYVYVVGPDNKAEQRRIKLGQSTPTTAVVASGLKEGELVVVDGLQKVRPGQAVSPGPASPSPGAPRSAMQGGGADGTAATAGRPVAETAKGQAPGTGAGGAIAPPGHPPSGTR